MPAVSNRPLSLLMSSCSGQGLDRFTFSNEHKDRVLLIRLQRLSTLTAHFRFSLNPAATRRNCDISLFHQNTKGVFSFKSSNISVSKRALPLFKIQLQRPDTRLLHPITRTQKPCSSYRVPVPVVSKRALPLFELKYPFFISFFFKYFNGFSEALGVDDFAFS